ncbi:MAG: LysE family transporter [Chloroflexota bacterium]
MLAASNLFIFVSSFFVGLSGSLIPGPFLTITIAESARLGVAAGVAMVVGHGIAELILVVALAKGLSQVLGKDYVTGSVSLLGGCFLLWMAFGIIGNAWGELEILDKGSTQVASGTSLVLVGIMASVFNPTWLVWWASIGATYVLSSLKNGTGGLASFYSGHILSDASLYLLVSFIVAAGRMLTADLTYRVILSVCGIFLVVLGLYFVFGGVRFWIGRLRPERPAK